MRKAKLQLTQSSQGTFFVERQNKPLIEYIGHKNVVILKLYCRLLLGVCLLWSIKIVSGWMTRSRPTITTETGLYQPGTSPKATAKLKTRADAKFSGLWLWPLLLLAIPSGLEAGAAFSLCPVRFRFGLGGSCSSFCSTVGKQCPGYTMSTPVPRQTMLDHAVLEITGTSTGLLLVSQS